MEWQQSDLDFPVLMLRTTPLVPFVSSLGGGPVESLSSVGVSYGEDTERLHLQTLARRGRRMHQYGYQWAADDLPAQAKAAVGNLLLRTIEPGTPGEQVRKRMTDYIGVGDHLAQVFPRDPWHVRPVPVDDVNFAMWFTTLPEGFAAALDYGPVVLGAWGDDLDAWDWRLTAVPPDTAWPLIQDFQT